MTPFLRLVFLEWLPYLTLMSRPGKKFRRPRKRVVDDGGMLRRDVEEASSRWVFLEIGGFKEFFEGIH